MEKPSLALWRKKVRTLNNKIASAFFALTACMAMAFGFLACSNDSEPPVVIVVPDNQTKNGGTKTDGETNAPVANPAIYTITFNANDGSPNPATVPQNFTAGIPQALTPVEELGFSKSGFSFAGWGRAPKSTQASYADGASYTATAPATLYALWSEIPVYSVNVPVNENGGVTATPATGSAGTEITLLAAPNAGYEFGAFTVTAEDGTDVPVTDNAFTMPDCNVSVSAAFAKIDYSITILGAENGGVSTENATANYGDTVTLEITPDEGYALATLTYALQDEEPVNIGGSGRQRSFAMPLGNVTVAATFTPIALSVNVADSIEGGTVAATPTNANVGDQIALVPTANAGWRFVSWNVMAEGGSPVTVENNKFTMPAKSVSVSATFEKINYAITVLPSDSGSVTGLPTGATVGTEIALSNTPNAGYKFVSYTVRGADGTAVTVADEKFTMPAKDVTVSAVFNAINYSVNIGTIVNGSVTATPTTATVGTSVVLTISPMSGYQLASLAVTDAGGSPVALNGTDNSRTFTMPASDVTVTAAFSLITYKIDVGAVENGSVVASPAAAAEGADVTLDIAPASGYALETLIVTAADGSLVSVSGTDNEKSFKMPAQSVTVSASFITIEMFKRSIPLTLEAVEAGVQVTFENKASVDVSYRINGGNVQTIARNSAGCITLKNAGDKVAFYGDNATYDCSTINCDKDCYVYGNIMSLVKRANYATADSVADYAFCKLFYNNTHIRNKVGAELLLPATTLAKSCYRDMFCGCTSLTSAPALPATTLAGGCYYNMFNGCKCLTSAPELPATTLAESCYSRMFSGCASLTVAPELPATTLAKSCYEQMFDGCKSLTVAPALPVTTLAKSCYEQMFYGCTSLTSAPALPVTTLAESCYSGMFSGCASLTVAPELPATTLAKSCYEQMFSGCTSLTSAPALPATTLAESCYRYMFSGRVIAMFDGCTKLTVAPELPATTLVESCYRDMFNGCASLGSIVCLATNISAADCTKDWLRGARRGTFIKELGVTIWTEGDSGIPSGWAVKDNNGGSVKVLDNIKNGTVKSDATFYSCGKTVTLTITPESGYKLSSLVVKDEDGKVIETSGTDDSRTFTMPAKNVTVSATFAAIYNINIGTFANGSVEANVTTAIAGTSVTLTVKPNAGYALKTLAYTPQGGSAISVGGSGNTRTFTMPAQNVTVSVTFAAINNVSIGTFAHGSVAASPASAIVGTSVTLTASPASGYRLDTLTVKDASGVMVSTSGTGDTRTFTMPDANVTVKATFVPITYSVNIGSSNHGTVTASKTSVAGGKSVTLTVKPDAGYRLDTLIVKDANGSTVSTSGSGNTKTFTMPEKDVTVTATFVAINYTVSVSSFEHGTVTADKTSGIYGTSVALTINPDSGYKLYVLTVKGTDGSAVSTSGIGDTRTFKIPVADVTVFAAFVPLAAFSTGAYTELPAGVDGSAGTSGTYVTYGLYPQTIIDKSVAINWEEEKTIGTFSCYKGSDGEWYSDVYKDGNVSWFKMEPIKWRVLTKNYNGKKLLLAENILTGCDYYDGDTSTRRKVYNKGELTLVYANNYNESRIKAYLCGCGYYDGKKEVSPGGGSTTDHFNVEFQGKGFKTEASLDTGYVSDIFLLSSGEVSSSEYGFNSTVRAKVVRTDYAMAKGGASWWWLRTPYTSMPNNDCVKVVEDDGDIGWMSVGYSFGVVPAICVDR